MATRKQLYDIALNSQGFILHRDPKNPAIRAVQKPLYNQRFAQGDRDYEDFQDWWYMAQTDFLGGMKDEVEWDDDAKFYYATNIDVESEPGAFKLALKQALYATLGTGEDIHCGVVGEVNNVIDEFLGTDDGAGNEPIIYQDVSGTMTDITSTPLAWTSQNVVAHMLARLNRLWSFSVGSGTTFVVMSWDGTNWVDYSDDIGGGVGAPLSWQLAASRCAIDVSGTIYVFVDRATLDNWALVKATAANPSAAADWTALLNITSSALPIACTHFNGNIYYILSVDSSIFELWQYNIAGATNTLITTFRNVSGFNNWGVGDKLLHVLGGKLIITVPPREIWEYTTAGVLTRIYNRDAGKNDLGTEAVGYLAKGGVLRQGKIYWGNLIYDGEHFYPWIKEVGDGTTNVFYPIMVDNNDVIWGTDAGNSIKIYKVSTTAYKGTADKNFIVFNNFSRVSGIDKLAYSITLIFKTLVSGDKIAVEYTTGELTSSTSWTALGNANFTDDGAISQKTLFFGDNVTFKKIWFRVKLEGGGSSTTSVYDFVLAYFPIPDYKLRFEFTVKCVDEIQRKDQTKEPKTGIHLRNLLRTAWLTKSILTFEDYDAAAEELVSGSLSKTATTITVKGTTDNFPERGRLLIGTEEITYTGKTKTTFTGCTRGVRGTIAVAHSDGDAISMAYRVLINNYSEELILADDPLQAEYRVSLSINEI